ncbi:MAG: phosphoribosylanthranilate isomerase [Acidobacteria bacterium]|nr:phosphoribosylanthranilate isomerase [Acidobacteriota bacterium]
MARRPLVKVCCIASLAEAGLAQAHGASALGLVSAMPSGPGVIPEQLIAEIAGALPAVDTFLLTALRNAEDLAAQHRRCRTRTLQLVDRVDAVELRKLRGLLPAVRLVQVVHVQGPRSVDEALAVAPLVDALLLDSGNPALERKELGGTGRTHDWLLSRRIREEAGRPVWLAGGLHPGNVAEAVACVEPHGVDVCSGLRRGGVLDPGLLAAFFAALPA